GCNEEDLFLALLHAAQLQQRALRRRLRRTQVIQAKRPCIYSSNTHNTHSPARHSRAATSTFLPCEGRKPSLLGSVDASVASSVAATNIARQGAGRRSWHSLAKSCNAAWRYLPRNPSGRACFCAMRRYTSLIWMTKLRSSCLASRKN